VTNLVQKVAEQHGDVPEHAVLDVKRPSTGSRARPALGRMPTAGRLRVCASCSADRQRTRLWSGCWNVSVPRPERSAAGGRAER
jgi:hypothetical protein